MRTTPRPRVVGLGAGGHAQVVVDLLASVGSWDVHGLLDARPERKGQRLLGVCVLGGDEWLANASDEGVSHFFVGVGSTGDTSLRVQLFAKGVEAGLEPVTEVHPTATVAADSELGPGTIVMAGAIVQTGCELGRNVVVNTGAIIEHGCQIGDHAFIATGAQLAGKVSVGRGAHVGLGASICETVEIGNEAVIGAGAVVLDAVEVNTIVAGVPASPLHSSGVEEL